MSKPKPMSDARLEKLRHSFNLGDDAVSECLREIDRLKAEAAKDAEHVHGQVMVWKVGAMAGNLVTVERMVDDDQTTGFAVRRGGICLSKSGKWEYEPMTSHRTKGWLKQHRWDSPQEASKAGQSAIAARAAIASVEGEAKP